MITNLLVNRMDLTLELFNMLHNVRTKKHIGSVSIDAVAFSVQKELVKRTCIGNFELTDKGVKLLNAEIGPEEI